MTEIRDVFSEIFPIAVSIGCIHFAVKFVLNIISGGSSYGLFDYVSDVFSDLVEHFKKPKSKKSVDFSFEWDNGFFNSDIYNSGGEKND